MVGFLKFILKKKSKIANRLTSPLNPYPNDIEIEMYGDLQLIYESNSTDKDKKIELLIKETLNSSKDTLLVLKSLENVVLAYFEDSQIGVENMHDLDLMTKAIDKTFNQSHVAILSKDLSKTFNYIFEQNEEGSFSPPAYGVLSVICEIIARLEKDPIYIMLNNMLNADNYAKMQSLWLAGNRSVRTGFNIEITALDDQTDYDRDICFSRADLAYNRTLEFIETLPVNDRRIVPLKYYTYYSLCKLYAAYPFLNNKKMLNYVNELEAVIPTYLQNNTINNQEYLNIYRNKISANYYAGNYTIIKEVLPDYYKSIEIEQPAEKLILNNGLIDLEDTGIGSEIFSKAKIFASPGQINRDIKTLNYIFRVITSDTADVGNPQYFLDAFNTSRFIEGPLTSQIVGVPGEAKLYKLISNIDSITQYEYSRMDIEREKIEKVDIKKSSDKNLICFYYSFSNRTMYILLKNKEKFKIESVEYPEFFESSLIEESNLDKKYKIANEKAIFNIVDNFFKDFKDQSILVIPDNFIFQLPLDGMSDEQDHYLVDKYKFEYAFNLNNSESPFLLKNKKMLCISSVTQFSDIFPSLPHTAEEGKLISKTVKKKINFDTLQGSESNEKSIMHKINDYDIIHFATHSYFTYQRPFASGIVVSKSPNDDGLITAYDFIERKDPNKPIELITLSSCQSASGAVVSNGALGLTYVLLNSNVSHVVSSIENVNDKVGKTFMSVFYEKLSEGNDLVTSLHVAKLYIKEQYNSRKFWCNFNLYSR